MQGGGGLKGVKQRGVQGREVVGVSQTRTGSNPSPAPAPGSQANDVLLRVYKYLNAGWSWWWKDVD